MSKMLDAALALVRAGDAVFPCVPNTKAPLGSCVPNGFKNATKDEAIVRKWWTAHPRANVAVATGAPSGFWTLDVDTADDLDLLQADHGPLPETRTTRTPRGGFHLDFVWTPDVGIGIKSSLKDRGYDADVRGRGGYVLRQPSITEDGSYTVEKDISPVPAPAWLVKLILTEVAKETPGPKPSTNGEHNPDIPFSVRVDRARRYLPTLDLAIQGEYGSDPCFWAARVFVRGFMLDRATARQFMNEYSAKCSPPWSAKEIEHKLDDAENKPFDKPVGWLLHAERGGRHATGTNGKPHDTPKAEAKPEEWEPPTALPTAPPVPDFPIDLFPDAVKKWWLARADRVNVPIDVIGAMGVAALGTAIGRAVAGQIVFNYARSPLFWTAAVAPSGSGKTTAADTVFDPLRDWDTDKTAEFQEAMAEFEEKEKCYKQKLKQWNQDQKEYEAAVKEWEEKEGDKGERPKRKEPVDPPEPPIKPVHGITVLENVTSETLPGILKDQPKGSGLLRDEVSFLLASLNQYKSGSGGDRAELLRLWSGEGVFGTTRGGAGERKHTVAPHCFLAVSGCMTVADAVQFSTGSADGKTQRDDGWRERFLVAWPNPRQAVPLRRLESIDDLEEGYASFVRRLITIPMKEVRKVIALKERVYQKPHKVMATDEAFQEWHKHDKWKCGIQNALDPNDPFRGWVAKLSHNALAAATMFFCLDLATEAQAEGRAIPIPFCGKIEARHVEAAWTLMRYFYEHSLRVWGNSPLAEQLRRAKAILEKLNVHGTKQATWTRANIHKLVDQQAWAKDRPPSELDKPLALLVEYGYLREAEAPRGRGRPTTRFEFNPCPPDKPKNNRGDIPGDDENEEKPLENDGFDPPNIDPEGGENGEFDRGDIPDAETLENKGKTNGETAKTNFAPVFGSQGTSTGRRRTYGPAKGTAAKGGSA